MNIESLLTAFSSFAIIGIFHPIVIKCEYYFSAKVWPCFFTAGIAFLIPALFTEGILSIILALLGTASLWSILELKQQEKRVEKGWFPKNPARRK